MFGEMAFIIGERERTARGVDSEIISFGCEEEAGGLYDKITARLAELPASAPVNQFDPRHP